MQHIIPSNPVLMEPPSIKVMVSGTTILLEQARAPSQSIFDRVICSRAQAQELLMTLDLLLSAGEPEDGADG